MEQDILNHAKEVIKSKILISKAPEMLELLKEAKEKFGDLVLADIIRFGYVNPYEHFLQFMADAPDHIYNRIESLIKELE